MYLPVGCINTRKGRGHWNGKEDIMNCTCSPKNGYIFFYTGKASGLCCLLCLSCGHVVTATVATCTYALFKVFIYLFILNF